MLTREEFYKNLAEDMSEFLPEQYKDAQITIRDVQKTNDTVLKGLTVIMPGTNFGPTVYVDQMYDQAMENGNIYEAMKNLAATITDALENHPIGTFDMSDIKDFDKIKSRLSVEIIDKELNKSVLEDIPSSDFGDCKYR